MPQNVSARQCYGATSREKRRRSLERLDRSRYSNNNFSLANRIGTVWEGIIYLGATCRKLPSFFLRYSKYVRFKMKKRKVFVPVNAAYTCRTHALGVKPGL